MSIDLQWLEDTVVRRKLSTAEKEHLREIVEVVYTPSGMSIVHQGTTGGALYLLRSGTFKIMRKVRGHEIQIGTGSEEGRAIGEMSLLSDEPTSASVIADSQCTTYRIPRDAFCRMMTEHVELAMAFLAHIVRGLASVIRRLDAEGTHHYNYHPDELS